MRTRPYQLGICFMMHFRNTVLNGTRIRRNDIRYTRKKSLLSPTSFAYECFSALLDIPGHSLHDFYDKFRCIHGENTMLREALEAVAQTALYRSNDNYLARLRRKPKSVGEMRLGRAVHFPHPWTLSLELDILSSRAL